MLQEKRIKWAGRARAIRAVYAPVVAGMRRETNKNVSEGKKRRSKSMVCAAREENAASGGFSLYRTVFFQYNKTMETNAGASPEGRNKL